ncbi:MAG: 30S ribosome-binding factor RbfA [Nitrospirota bacterium]|nr:30S ribosome-binding factor RbfA [Nitrospirota bacterium]
MAKPTYKRAERVADQIRMEVADIIARKSKDPRLNLVTVTNVEVSNDLRNARVYVTTLQSENPIDEVLAGLDHALGFIRSELGRRLELRYTPELMFKSDASGPQAERIWKLLDELPSDSPKEMESHEDASGLDKGRQV